MRKKLLRVQVYGKKKSLEETLLSCCGKRETAVTFFTGFPGGLVVKNPSAKQETRVQSLVRDDLLEKEMATHSSILAWAIP